MASKKLNKKNNSGFNINTLKSLCVKYKKYLSAGVMLAVLAVVLVSLNGASEKKPENADTQQEEDAGDTAGQDYTLPDEEFEVDAHEEVTSLIASYYDNFAKGDTASLEKTAYPISDTEKSYIEMFSKYVEKYDNIKCYTKSGIDGDDYLVSVSLDMKFKNVDTPAPGLDFFYVRKDDAGAYYIDNAYSQFNQSNQENATELEINTLITEFEQDDDVIELQEKMQKEYEKAVASDDKLKEMVEKTIPDAVSEWVSGFSGQQTAADDGTDTKADDAKEDTKADDSGTDTKADDTKADDTKADSSETDTKTDDAEKDSTDSAKKVVKRTAYAKTTVNIRKRRSTESDILFTVDPGTKMIMYGKSANGWCKVRYRRKTGYVRLDYITFDKSKVERETDDTASSDEGASTGLNYVPEGTKIELSESVNVRKSMSETADKVGLAYQGDVVTVIMSYAEGWTKVEWNGQTGYIKTEFLK